jgi:hypothetical protein
MSGAVGPAPVTRRHWCSTAAAAAFSDRSVRTIIDRPQPVGYDALESFGTQLVRGGIDLVTFDGLMGTLASRRPASIDPGRRTATASVPWMRWSSIGELTCAEHPGGVVRNVLSGC